MREIKFRAWVRKLKVWADSVCVYSDGSFSARVGNVEGYDSSECDLVEYTGLKDKQGKEIYEGDIVEYKPFICCNSQGSVYDCVRGEVGFDSGHFSAGSVKGRYGMQMLWDLEKYKVIGNIYENPELLEVSNGHS
jgi:uncharacterized phage protein (TIGR01671 family)